MVVPIIKFFSYYFGSNLYYFYTVVCFVCFCVILCKYLLCLLVVLSSSGVGGVPAELLKSGTEKLYELLRQIF
jgi:hypothetical protein